MEKRKGKNIDNPEKIDNKFYYPLNKINQVIPPKGIYLCKDNNLETVRIEITEDYIIANNINNIESLTF